MVHCHRLILTLDLRLVAPNHIPRCQSLFLHLQMVHRHLLKAIMIGRFNHQCHYSSPSQLILEDSKSQSCDQPDDNHFSKSFICRLASSLRAQLLETLHLWPIFDFEVRANCCQPCYRLNSATFKYNRLSSYLYSLFLIKIPFLKNRLFI